jgi:fatty acid desaturase
MLDQALHPRRPGGGSPGESGSDYAHLSRRVRQAGLLDRRRRYYLIRMAVAAALFAAAWIAFALIGESWWQLFLAAALAVIFTQIGFLGHDAGHRQIFRSRRANDLAGLVHANLAIGLSYGWWINKHNRHHANPNTEGQDPDLAVEPLSFTNRQARGRRGLSRSFARAQAYLFVPLLLLEGLNLHVNSVKALCGRQRMNRRPAEVALLALHLAGYLGVVFLVLSPLQAVVFLAVHQAVFGVYLGSSFAPNHKGMPVLQPGNTLDYLRRQVLTSRNVSGGWFTDTAMGGLNYQIEHHLFPSMPRPNLRRAQRLVREFCHEHDISYCETTLIRSWKQALSHLDAIGRGMAPTEAA